MFGNDVVDIAQSRRESNWQRPGFTNKLFTECEQDYISTHSNPETMVWVLWSMKEAAYKAYNRKTGIRGFFPKKLVCELLLDTSFAGRVCIADSTFYTVTKLKSSQIHTAAAESIAELQLISEVNKSTPVYKCHKGLPYINDYVTGTSIPVSVSHHGNVIEIISITDYIFYKQ